MAPEPCLSKRLQGVKSLEYLSGDLDASSAMVKIDITDICYPAETFDVIYCSHVLEHIPDDRRAMRELCRVLKPNGWAILQVPITAAKTFEDPTVTDPRDRERLFGQQDHVRAYGPDYKDRLAEAGFQVTVDPFARELGEKTARYYGLMESEEIYFCRKAEPRGSK